MNNISHELLMKFLKSNFPVRRIRDKRSFKKKIIITNNFTGLVDNKYFDLTKANDMNSLIAELYTILKNAFNFTPNEIGLAIKKYLKLKD